MAKYDPNKFISAHIEFFALGSLGLMEKEKPNNE